MQKSSSKNWLILEQEILKAKTDGKNLLELTTYRGIALWWFIRFRLYHSAEANRIVRLLVRNQHVFSLADFLYDFLTLLLCRLILKSFKFRKKQGKLRVLMFASNSAWGEILDPDGKPMKGDTMLEALIRELRQRGYEIITISQLKYSISAVKIMIERSKTRRIIHKESNLYWSMKTWIKEYYAKKHFRHIWESLSENDGKFVALLEKHQLTQGMRDYFNSFLGHVVKQMEMAKEIVQDQAPDLILVTSEYGFFERGLVVAGKFSNIPTLALQHGNIGPVHEGYVYPKKTISLSGSAQSPYCPIPDKTAVYGPFYRDILTKTSAYPSKSVVVTGQPRYDKLVRANKVYDRNDFCTKLGFDTEKKIVLVATQGWPLREIFINCVLDALKEFPEVQLAIKPHPRENIELYRRVVKEQRVRAEILPESSDTIEALFSCDLLVAAFSTVITEALILGKPAVTWNLTVDDPAPYYKKATLRVNRKEEIVPAINKALYDKTTKEKLRKSGKDFVFNHTFNQDGRATERVVNLIEEMIRKKNR